MTSHSDEVTYTTEILDTIYKLEHDSFLSSRRREELKIDLARLIDERETMRQCIQKSLPKNDIESK